MSTPSELVVQLVLCLAGESPGAFRSHAVISDAPLHHLISALEAERGLGPASPLFRGATLRAIVARLSELDAAAMKRVEEFVHAHAEQPLSLERLAENSLASRLTAAERNVLSYLHLGYTNSDIALACGSSPRTVRNQLSSAYAKLGVASRAEAAAWLIAQRG